METDVSSYEYRSWSLRRAGCKTYTGKGMGVLNVREALASSALTIRTVQSEHRNVKIMEDLLTVALGFSWLSPAQTSTSLHWTRGTRWRIFANTRFITSIQTLKILSLANLTVSFDHASHSLYMFFFLMLWFSSFCTILSIRMSFCVCIPKDAYLDLSVGV